MKNQPRVAIIISSYNQRDLLFNCISSLKTKTSYKNYRIYLVDDSGKGIIDQNFLKKYTGIKLIINPSNRGFSAANNMGIKKAIKDYNPQYFLLLNDDCEIIEKNWLSNMIESASTGTQVGIVGCKLVYPDLSPQWVVDTRGKISFLTSPGSKRKVNETKKDKLIDNIIGACFLIKREVINKIGLLDEIYSPFYGEETDYCYRARKAGFFSLYCAGSKVVHNRNSSISKKDNNYVWFIKKKNSIILEWRHFNALKNFECLLIHLASTLYSRDRKRINLDVFYKIYLLAKAYWVNFKNLKKILAS